MTGKETDHFDKDRSLREEIAYTRLVSELARCRSGGPGPAEARGGAAGRRRVRGGGDGRRGKLTLNLDAEVAKWFRAMGLGYQARMNDVLRSWMVSVVAREIAASEARRR